MSELEKECENLIIKAREYVRDSNVNHSLYILEMNRNKFKKVKRELKFEYYVVLGYIYIIQGNLLSAVEIVKRSLIIAGLLKDNVKKARSYYLLGLSSHRKGDLRQSNRYLRRAIYYLGDSEEVNLRDAIMEVSFINSLILGKPRDPGLVTEVIKVNSIFDRYLRAFQRFHLVMYDKAMDDIKICKEEWQRSEDNIYLIKAFFLSALVLFKSGRFQEAFDEINKLIEKQIKVKDMIGLAKAYFLLGLIEKSLGRINNSKDAFTKAEHIFGILNEQSGEYLSKIGKESLK
ncbi:MAG: tetratricopeptide repeat protein [bacterium]